jgi:hypothetical protein
VSAEEAREEAWLLGVRVIVLFLVARGMDMVVRVRRTVVVRVFVVVVRVVVSRVVVRVLGPVLVRVLVCVRGVVGVIAHGAPPRSVRASLALLTKAVDLPS